MSVAIARIVADEGLRRVRCRAVYITKEIPNG